MITLGVIIVDVARLLQLVPSQYDMFLAIINGAVAGIIWEITTELEEQLRNAKKAQITTHYPETQRVPEGFEKPTFTRTQNYYQEKTNNHRPSLVRIAEGKERPPQIIPLPNPKEKKDPFDQFELG